jgi:hypothetical protein
MFNKKTYDSEFRRQRIAFINYYKLKIGHCAHCKLLVTKENTVCFDFDHIEWKDKTNSISAMTLSSFDAIHKEITKCQLLCSNCHRLHTHNNKHWQGHKKPVLKIAQLTLFGDAK